MTTSATIEELEAYAKTPEAQAFRRRIEAWLERIEPAAIHRHILDSGGQLPITAIMEFCDLSISGVRLRLKRLERVGLAERRPGDIWQAFAS